MSSYQQYRVIKKVQESSLVVSLYLEPIHKTITPKFLPGQHLLFKFRLPGSDIPVFRFYSFSDAWHPDFYRISVKKEIPPVTQPDWLPGRCSAYIVDTLQEGEILEAKGPSGDFVLDTTRSEPVVLIAGGIGITPLLSMLRSVTQQQPNREVWFFYGVNEQQEHAFFEELRTLQQEYPSLHGYTFYTQVKPEDRIGHHYDFEGFVNAKTILHLTGNSQLHHYICGPEIMIRTLRSNLIELGVDEQKVHSETFALPMNGSAVELAEAMNVATADAEDAHSPADVFQLEFRQSNKKIPWDARYRSILEFAEAHDINISSGCLFGDCGTCLTKLQEGAITYTHPTMAKPDPGCCLPCSCIPASDLVLEA